jgi:ribosomal protein L30E
MDKIMKSGVEKGFIWIASMKDVIQGEDPQQHHIEVKVKLSKETKDKIEEIQNDPELETDMKIFVETHKVETGKEKVKHIKEIAMGHRKVVIVAKYKDTIEFLRKELEKERPTYVITGEVKDTNAVLNQARSEFETYIIIQSQISAGFELSEFTAMIFAQEGYKYSDFVQMKGRIRRINNLHEVWYYYLIGGEKDRLVRKTLAKGEDLDLSNLK